MPTDETITGLTLVSKREEESNRYVFGVVIDGAFVPLAQARLGDVDPLREDARVAASEAGTTSPVSETAATSSDLASLASQLSSLATTVSGLASTVQSLQQPATPAEPETPQEQTTPPEEPAT